METLYLFVITVMAYFDDLTDFSLAVLVTSTFLIASIACIFGTTGVSKIKSKSITENSESEKIKIQY